MSKAQRYDVGVESQIQLLEIMEAVNDITIRNLIIEFKTLHQITITPGRINAIISTIHKKTPDVIRCNIENTKFSSTSRVRNALHFLQSSLKTTLEC